MSKTIEISEETWEKIKDQVEDNEIVEIDSYQDFVGKKMFIQTATYHYTAIVKKVLGKLLELEDAAWQAYQPRLSDFLKGETDEVEPVGRMWLNIDWIVSIIPWRGDIKMVQK